MITDAILSFFGGILHTIMSALPVIQVPGWLASGSGAVSTVFGFVGSMGVWFPGGLALSVIGALLAVWLVGFGIKIARIVISLFTFGGGSAA